MRLSLILFAASVAAFTIPDGQPDGVYSVDIDASGNEVHTFLHDLPKENEVPALDSRYVNRRQVAGTDVVGCGNYPLGHGNTDAAVNGVVAQCGNGASVGKGHNFYSLSGCVVAYFCNLSGGNVLCKLRVFPSSY